MPRISLCWDTPSSFSTPATSAASTTVPAKASTNRRVADQVPGVPARVRPGSSSAIEPSGAAMIPASRNAASISQLSSSCRANYPVSG